MAKVKVDLSQVQEGGAPRVPEGDYRVRIKDSRLKDSQAGNSMIVWTLEFLDGKYEGKTIDTRTVLTPKSLWVLKKLLEATGAAVPRKMVEIDTKKYHGKILGITCTDREYEDKNGKSRVASEVSDFLDPDAVKIESGEDDDMDEIEAPEESKKGKAKKDKKAKKKKKSDDDDEVESLDLDEL